MLKLVIFLLLINLVSAIDVDLNCPDKVYANEEFKCSVDISGGDGVYDVKIDLDGERNSALKVWNGGVWKSGYYYLKEFIKNGNTKDIRLIVSKEGRYTGILKLRQGNEKDEFDVGQIKIEKDRGIEENRNKAPAGNVDLHNNIDSEKKNLKVIFPEGNREVISLNGDINTAKEKEKWDYVSKDGKIVDWLPYGFCSFLICLVGVLMWDKRNRYI